MPENILPIFFSRSGLVSCFIIKSLNHFEFIFVCGVRKCSDFIHLRVAVQLSQYHLLKRLSFLHCIVFLCHRLLNPTCVGLFLGSPLCSMDLCVCFCPIPCCSDYYSFIVWHEVWKGYASGFVLFPPDCFGNFESFMVPYFKNYNFDCCVNFIVIDLNIS